MLSFKMAAVARLSRLTIDGVLLGIVLLLVFAVYPSYGGCIFPASWTGKWFQSGVGIMSINATHIEQKGLCLESESGDKFLLYNRTEDCYRCIVIHEKHASVLQYKETYCASEKRSLSDICDGISGDAALYSMFRKFPPPEPQACPFRQAPFTFTYSRGSGDCVYPVSRAESCTDDSRLRLVYQACPDVPGTESNVEELICLATWKEGSQRYLVGQITQLQRRNSIYDDEELYRCFIYHGFTEIGHKRYQIAQSGDASCGALTSSSDGSRTITLTDSDEHHKRCQFPAWITEHHKWFNLDHSHQYHFTQRNATLKIKNEDGSIEERRLVCHSILAQQDNKIVKLVAHVTKGCESGHVCLTFHRRLSGVLELQQGRELHDSPEETCSNSDSTNSAYITLIATSLQPFRCPIFGRYSVSNSLADRRRRRQQTATEVGSAVGVGAPECVSGDYDSLQIGCGASQDTMEFKSSCTSTVYTCHGGWQEGSLGFLVAAPQSRQSRHPGVYCFMYTSHTHNDSRAGAVEQLRISAVARSCDRNVIPGMTGDKAYNLTINGTCAQSSMYNSGGGHLVFQIWLLLAAFISVAHR